MAIPALSLNFFLLFFPDELSFRQSGGEEGDRPGVEDRRLRRGLQQHDVRFFFFFEQSETLMG